MPGCCRLPVLVVVLALLAGGCAGPVVVGGLTINDFMTGASLASTLFSGKGLGEHALDAVTGRDCRILEGIIREDRELCEEPGSPATDNDFAGVLPLLRRGDGNGSPGAPTAYAALSYDTGPRGDVLTELALRDSPTTLASSVESGDESEIERSSGTDTSVDVATVDLEIADGSGSASGTSASTEVVSVRAEQTVSRSPPAEPLFFDATFAPRRDDIGRLRRVPARESNIVLLAEQVGGAPVVAARRVYQGVAVQDVAIYNADGYRGMVMLGQGMRGNGVELRKRQSSEESLASWDVFRDERVSWRERGRSPSPIGDIEWRKFDHSGQTCVAFYRAFAPTPRSPDFTKFTRGFFCNSAGKPLGAEAIDGLFQKFGVRGYAEP